MLKKMISRVPIAFVLMAFVTVAALVGTVFAAEAGEDEVDVGDPMPDFTLRDHNGKSHQLKTYVGKVVVLDFSSHKCPYSRGVDPDVAKLAAQYKDKGVVVLSVDSHKDTTPSEIKAYAEKNELPFPILKDTGNQYADLVGAKRTPEIFVLDMEGRLAYHGAFDNRKDPAKAGPDNHVKNAIDSLLAGKAVDPAEVKGWGCTIKRVPKPREGS